MTARRQQQVRGQRDRRSSLDTVTHSQSTVNTNPLFLFLVVYINKASNLVIQSVPSDSSVFNLYVYIFTFFLTSLWSRQKIKEYNLTVNKPFKSQKIPALLNLYTFYNNCISHNALQHQSSNRKQRPNLPPQVWCYIGGVPISSSGHAERLTSHFLTKSMSSFKSFVVVFGFNERSIICCTPPGLLRTLHGFI